MSLYNDIEKATHIPCTDNGAYFVRFKGKQNEFNKRKPKTPRNVNLLEDDASESYSDTATDYVINENEIAASIRVANGGVSYSNEILEHHWKATKHDTSQSDSGSLQSSSFLSRGKNDSTHTCTENINDTDISNVKMEDLTDLEEKLKVLEKCRLSKNAAILGLLKNDKISLKDLQVPNSGNCENTVKNQNDRYKMQLVECPEDSGVLVQPLQAFGTIDESKYKEIDFTVARLGRKKIVTPRQYYIYEVEDSAFDFI